MGWVMGWARIVVGCVGALLFRDILIRGFLGYLPVSPLHLAISIMGIAISLLIAFLPMRWIYSRIPWRWRAWIIERSERKKLLREIEEARKRRRGIPRRYIAQPMWTAYRAPNRHVGIDTYVRRMRIRKIIGGFSLLIFILAIGYYVLHTIMTRPATPLRNMVPELMALFVLSIVVPIIILRASGLWNPEGYEIFKEGFLLPILPPFLFFMLLILILPPIPSQSTSTIETRTISGSGGMASFGGLVFTVVNATETRYVLKDRNLYIDSGDSARFVVVRLRIENRGSNVFVFWKNPYVHYILQLIDPSGRSPSISSGYTTGFLGIGEANETIKRLGVAVKLNPSVLALYPEEAVEWDLLFDNPSIRTYRVYKLIIKITENPSSPVVIEIPLEVIKLS
jgi:hypothetical protein